jgi:hypothetical protein
MDRAEVGAILGLPGDHRTVRTETDLCPRSEIDAEASKAYQAATA